MKFEKLSQAVFQLSFESATGEILMVFNPRKVSIWSNKEYCCIFKNSIQEIAQKNKKSDMNFYKEISISTSKRDHYFEIPSGGEVNRFSEMFETWAEGEYSLENFLEDEVGWEKV